MNTPGEKGLIFGIDYRFLLLHKVELYKERLQKLNQKTQELRPHHAHTARNVLLIHGNARARVALANKDEILELCWESLSHSAYSP